MSSIQRKAIRLLNEQALATLGGLSEVPNLGQGEDQSSADYASFLKKVKRRLDLEIETLQEFVTSLRSEHQAFVTLRGQLTGKEREQEDELVNEFSETVHYHETIRDLLSKIKEFKYGVVACEDALDDVSPSANVVQIPPIPPTVVVQAPPIQSFTLPRLRLPNFDGSVTNWTSFWDRFSFAVHQSDNLPDVIKFSYLLNCLSGRARALVEGLPVDNKSYSIAISILSEKFGQRSATISELYSNLDALRCRGSHNAAVIVFISEIEKILLQLEHQGEDVEAYFLYLLITKKLPQFLLRDIVKAENRYPDQPAMKVLRQKLKEFSIDCDKVNSIIRHGVAASARPIEESRNINRNVLSNGPRFVSQFGVSSFVPPLSRATPFANSQSGQNNIPLSGPPRNSNFVRSRFQASLPAPDSTLVSSSNPSNRNPCSLCNQLNHYAPSCRQFSTVESRIKRLSELGRCPKCGSPNHSDVNCSVKKICFTCKGDHMTMLCKQGAQARAASNQTNAIVTEDSTPIQESTNFQGVASRNTVLLKCVKIEVFNPNHPEKKCEVLALLDDGSTTSYVSQALIDHLQLKSIGSNTISFGVFNEPISREVKSDLIPLSINCSYGSPLEIIARSIKYLTRPIPFCLASDVNLFSDKNPIICEYGAPDILIGGDYYYDLDLVVTHSLPSGFKLLESRIGRIVAGKSNGPANCLNPNGNVYITLHSDLEVNERVSKFLELDVIGIDAKENREKSDLYAEFRNSVKLKNGRYEVALPWKHDPNHLSNNFGLAIGRLRSVLNSLRRKPELLKKYDTILREQLELGIIEKAPFFSREVHYLPHQPVIREDKGKVRIVYDGSAKASKDGKSLNECLDPGPVLLEGLVGILLRFRIPRIVVACDIEKAFLQIGLSESDRDVTRFLWVENPFDVSEQPKIVTYRFARVAFGLTCSPFLLAATLAHHFSSIGSALSKEILTNLYVDNILLCGLDPVSVLKKCVDTKVEFSRIGMNVREFVSNDLSCLKDLAEEDCLPGDNQKFLGIDWNVKEDKLGFSMPKLSEKVITKRVVLSVMSSLFDPIGLLSPLTVRIKLLVQRLWQEDSSWDKPVSEECVKEWESIVNNWSDFRIHIPRCCSITDAVEFSLHVFTDASNLAFGCCVYLVSENRNGMKRVRLVFGKSKVRPLRVGDFSIHRMELLGVAVGVKAVQFVYDQLSKAEININFNINLWTDSSTVLHWLNGSAKQQTFVENRLKTIREAKNLICRYVPTEDNPADLLSRGCSANELESCKKWWKGPTWICDQLAWPRVEGIPIFASKSSRVEEHTVIAAIEDPPICVVDVNKFSSWNKLVRVVSWVFRFIRNCKFRFKTVDWNLKRHCEKFITVEELRISRLYLVLYAQKEYPPSKDERLHLKLFEGEKGLLRSGGRIDNSSASFGTCNPIFLPCKSRATILLIGQYHLDLLHAGTLLTLSQLRLEFWIPRGRRTVMQAIRKTCMTCRRFSAQPFKTPEFPQLPKERVQVAIPFENVGIDYFGPVNVKIGSDLKKIWVALFTCFVVRAVHLEIVFDLTTNGFLLSFRRFVARRGAPKVICSDNGTQLKMAAKMLNVRDKEEWAQKFPDQEFLEFIAKRGTRWNFITERAPWKGGFYERMVGLVKAHLKRCIGRKLLDLEAFLTIINEAETMVNLRPICFVSDKLEGSPLISPMDFLNAHVKYRSLDGFSEDGDCFGLPDSHKKLLSLWSASEQHLSRCWAVWRRDYLLSLRERQRRLNNSDVIRVPRKGELVLVFDENLPRLKWSYAIVEGEESEEGESIRSVHIRLPSGRVTKRAINQLFPLETAFEDYGQNRESNQFLIDNQAKLRTCEEPNRERRSTNSERCDSRSTHRERRSTHSERREPRRTTHSERREPRRTTLSERRDSRRTTRSESGESWRTTRGARLETIRGERLETTRGVRPETIRGERPEKARGERRDQQAKTCETRRER